MRFHKSFILILIALALLACLPSLMAQTLTTGAISGTVMDPTKAVIPDVTLTLKSLDTGATQATVSSAVGFFNFKLLKPGNYQIFAKAPGFAELTLAVTVNLGQTTTADLTMEITKTAETIEVSGVAPVVTQTASTNTSFTQLEMQEMPTAGGDITNIAETSPGAVPNGQGGYGNFTVNGMPATSNLFTINGENDMDPYFNTNNSGAANLTLGNNEVQETTVVTNPYGGEYGQLAGAQVTYVTKSGTNNFHGNAQWWWNGRFMNGNNWLNENSGGDRPFSNANQWAASVGGPIFKNKTFFFFDTEGLRFVLPNVIYTLVPTQPFANAVLANIANVNPAELPAYQTMFNLFANAKGASAAQPLALSDGGGCGDLNNGNPVLMGLPGFDATTQPCAADYYATPTGMSKQWILSFRIDQNISQSDKAFFRYRMDRGLQPTTLDPISSNFNATSNQPAFDMQVQETHIFGPHTTNAFTAAVSHYVALFDQNHAAVASTNFPWGFLAYGGSVNFGWDMGNGVYGFNTQSSFPQGRNFTQYQFIDDISVIRGNHSLKFGANFHRYDVSDHNFFYTHPRVYFDAGSAADLVNGNPDGMQQFVNGWGYQYRQADNPVSNVPVALWYLGAYGQDEWNVRKGLKLTLALRLERNSNPVCNVNCFANFTGPWNTLASVQAAAAGNDPGAVPYTSDIRYGQQSVYPSVDKLDFSPRFGFSWSPRGNNTLVVSGGAAIFYDSPATGLVDNILGNPPASAMFRIRTAGASPVLNGTLVFDPGPNGAAASYTASAAAFGTGFPGGQSYNQIKAAVTALGGRFNPPAFNSLVGTLHAPQWQEWNLQVQKELNRNTALVLGYVGNHGIQIPYGNPWPNAYDPYGVFPGIIPDGPVENNYGTVTQYQSGAVSNYNGMTVTVKRRFSNWVSGHLNYTWSHNLDEISNGGVFTYGDSILGQINPYSLRANNYGNSDYDARHLFNADFVFTPKPKLGSKLMSEALGDWTFSGKMFYHTGLPFTVTDSALGWVNGGGAYLAYPIEGGATPGASSCGKGNAGVSAVSCLNPGAFFDITAPTATQYPGWSGERRNQYRGPGYFDMDLNLFKNFNIKEKMTLAVGMTAFNALNHPNFNNPQSGLNGPDFGQITSMVGTPTSPYGSFLGFDSSPRVVQLSAKVTF